MRIAAAARTKVLGSLSRLVGPIRATPGCITCQLYADLVGHWEKRNRQALEKTNPDNLDVATQLSFAEKYGSAAVADAVRRRESLEGDSHSKLTGGLEDLDYYFLCNIT